MKLIKIPDLVTLFNLISGMLSIYFSIKSDFVLASIFLFLAVIFDLLDGKIARLLKLESRLGKELDSLSDLVSFGVAPAFLSILLFDKILILIISILFVCAGAFRLARFNVTNKKIFEGMPITLNGIIFPILFFINSSYYIFIFALIISSFLMISKIKVKRL